MLNRMASKAVRFARGTALALGATVMLALILGVATTAMAGSGVGATFNLGKVNSVNAVSKLAGVISGSMLVVDNNGSGSALDLQVGPLTTAPADKSVAPMKVDSQARVENLNADEIDGKDSSQFMTTSTYSSQSPGMLGEDTGTGNGLRRAEWSCDSGDQLLAGGFRYGLNSTSLVVVRSSPSYFDNNWIVEWTNTATNGAGEMVIYVNCADTAPPAHG